MPDWISALFSPKTIIYYGGMLLLLAVVFAETGLMIGILFPGDSLIFTAGLLTRVGILQHDWPVVAGFIALAAFLGDQSGYFIGWRTGRALFQRPKSLLFRPEYVTMTRNFYQKYGAWVLILGKFLPVIRTFAPLPGRCGRDALSYLCTHECTGISCLAFRARAHRLLLRRAPLGRGQLSLDHSRVSACNDQPGYYSAHYCCQK